MCPCVCTPALLGGPVYVQRVSVCVRACVSCSHFASCQACCVSGVAGATACVSGVCLLVSVRAAHALFCRCSSTMPRALRLAAPDHGSSHHPGEACCVPTCAPSHHPMEACCVPTCALCAVLTQAHPLQAARPRCSFPALALWAACLILGAIPVAMTAATERTPIPEEGQAPQQSAPQTGGVCSRTRSSTTCSWPSSLLG